MWPPSVLTQVPCSHMFPLISHSFLSERCGIKYWLYTTIFLHFCFFSYMASSNLLFFNFFCLSLFNLCVFKFPPLCEKCPYSEFFWSVFSRIRTEYGEIRRISPNVEKYGPDKLGIRTLFTQCTRWNNCQATLISLPIHFLPSSLGT